MYEIELDPGSGGIKEGAKPVAVASNTGEHGNPLEAPFMRFHDGYYYLFVTYGLAAQGVRSTYRTVVGRSKDPEGPFEGFDGKPMTEGGHADLLKSSPPMFGPGGGNMFQDEKGEWWLAYHYYDSNLHWVRDTWGRPTLQIRKVVWGKDGWPLPGLPDGVVLDVPRHRSPGGSWKVQIDFGDPVEYVLSNDGTVRSGPNSGLWVLDGNHLVLNWTSMGSASNPVVDQLELDETQQFWVGRTHSGLIIRGVKLDAKFREL
jgi:arabinan endo-1,5-alpha-L-arabinosidase